MCVYIYIHIYLHTHTYIVQSESASARGDGVQVHVMRTVQSSQSVQSAPSRTESGSSRISHQVCVHTYKHRSRHIYMHTCMHAEYADVCMYICQSHTYTTTQCIEYGPHSLFMLLYVAVHIYPHRNLTNATKQGICVHIYIYTHTHIY